MCALQPDETRSINIEEGELDEGADLDDIGGIVFRDMLFEAVENKAMFIKDYKKAIKIAQKDTWDQVFREFDDLETIVDISGHSFRKEE